MKWWLCRIRKYLSGRLHCSGWKLLSISSQRMISSFILKLMEVGNDPVGLNMRGWRLGPTAVCYVRDF